MNFKSTFHLFQLFWLSKQGAYIVRKIAKEHSNEIVFLAFSGIGDICYSFAFLDELKKKIGKNVVVFTRKYTEPLVSKYAGIDDVIVVNEKVAKQLSKFLERPGKNAFLLNDGTNGKLIYSCHQWQLFNYSIMKLAKDFLEVQQHIVYGLDNSSRITYPESIMIKNLQDYSNSIILNPFSNYVTIESRPVFEVIANHFIKEGFDVYTNMVPGKNAIRGTKELVCKIDELYSISRLSKLIVSVRSGILDYLVSNGGNYFVLYPDLWKGLFYKAYTLNAWKTKSHITEVTFSSEDDIIPRLVEFERALKWKE